MSEAEELRERLAAVAVQDRIRDVVDLIDASGLWRWGDGHGGWFFARLECALDAVGLERDPEREPTQGRRPIPGHVRREVYERDAYRCVQCDGHLDLTLDHIVPVIRGGSDDPSNLQTMCRICNSRKGARTL